MTFEPLAVVVVPFPFSDRPGAKRRPALVVSSAVFNAGHRHVVCAMITSAPGPDWPSDVHLENWRETGLSVPCRVRFKLFTLDRSLILDRIGTLSGPDARAVRAKINDLFDNA